MPTQRKKRPRTVFKINEKKVRKYRSSKLSQKHSLWKEYSAGLSVCVCVCVCVCHWRRRLLALPLQLRSAAEGAIRDGRCWWWSFPSPQPVVRRKSPPPPPPITVQGHPLHLPIKPLLYRSKPCGINAWKCCMFLCISSTVHAICDVIFHGTHVYVKMLSLFQRCTHAHGSCRCPIKRLSNTSCHKKRLKGLMGGFTAMP